MNEPIEVFIPLIFIFLIVLVIDYLKNHCLQCKAWHPFRSGLIVLEKHSDKYMEELKLQLMPFFKSLSNIYLQIIGWWSYAGSNRGPLECHTKSLISL